MASGIRKKMIDGAMSLLARRGLHGASFSELLAETGAPRGSLYHHFPAGKEELVAASVEEAGRILLQAMESVAGASAEIVTERFLAIWHTVLTRGDCKAGCAVLAVTVDGAPPDLLARAAQVFASWRDALTDLLTKGGLPKKQARSFAVTLIAATEGAVALSRASGDAEPFETVARQMIEQVRHLSSSASATRKS